jgi:hypothetical protein
VWRQRHLRNIRSAACDPLQDEKLYLFFTFSLPIFDF